MRVNGKHYRTVWMEEGTVCMIDQNLLPFEFSIYRSGSCRETCEAIRRMVTRGAGAIGATAGFAMVQAFLESGDSAMPAIDRARRTIEATRPTARDLFAAVSRVYRAGVDGDAEKARQEAEAVAEENVQAARAIGRYGQELLKTGARIETHCNAGWLGFVDHGSALAPVYEAAARGKELFVYVDETRPRGQGARLTAWELRNEGIPHAIIPDNAGAYYMARGDIDLVIVGADRIAANGDVANKIGTLEKAIAAAYYGIPFYVAAPLSTFDVQVPDGKSIPIEQRDPDEVLFQEGPGTHGGISRILVANPGSSAYNPAFDITPSGLVTGIITEKGLIKPDVSTIKKLLLHG